MWNLPNILTLARLGVLPVIVFLVWPGIERRDTAFWSGVIFGVGSLLDMVDGAIARRYNLVTVFGKFLDPLADKLFYLVTLIALLQLPGPRVPPILVMIILMRELAITGLRGIAVSEGIVIAAGEGGKLKSTFATLGGTFLLVHYPYVLDFGFGALSVNFHRVGLWLTLLSVAFSLVSGAGYVRGFVRAMKEKAAGGSRKAV
jgi:CDP-diacylglycerol---glycerol-3-phosphate 3-phosphatidyltransferase